VVRANREERLLQRSGALAQFLIPTLFSDGLIAEIPFGLQTYNVEADHGAHLFL